MNFIGQRALVTGAGRGIGKAIALKLADLGIHVVALDRNQGDLDSLVMENNSIEIICVDLMHLGEVEYLIKKVMPIQLLVNNAGVSTVGNDMDATLEEFDLLFGVNVKALMRVSQIVAKDLLDRSMKGSIVNMSSVAGQVALPDHILYAATKASVSMMTKSFALELGPKGIRVNAVSPTVVMTEMGRMGWSEPKKANKMLSRIPQGRFVEVEEVVNCVLFLLSEQSQMVNGHSLPVDGGLLAN